MFYLYIDPGTGSMLISAILALFSLAFFMLKGFFYRKFSFGGSKGIKLDLKEKYGLVFYSEGKQYWNVFKPLLEECSLRAISCSYFSSDKEDPGLTAKLEHVESHFIGAGRETYYFLNRLSAEMLVMTTPGLDVLELKRSKNVKHYCHITHAAGGAARYKTYGTDYYDSVLVGGDGDKQLIRELESKRNIKKKDIEIIGCTYLDILREKLANTKYGYTLFSEERSTVLVSPTWGNHGLLTKYGDMILSKLEKSDLFNVIIRPHPQSFISENKLMEKLIEEFPNNEHRVWDREIDGLKAMAHADIMISDFSGIIFDFLFLFEKPILTMHGHYEKRGRDAMDLDQEPWDVRILDQIGQIIDETDIKILPEIINYTLEQTQVFTEEIAKAKNDMDKYPGESGVRGINFINGQLEKQKKDTIIHTGEDDEEVLVTDLSLDYHSGVSLGKQFKHTFNTLIYPNAIFQILMSLIFFNTYILIGSKILPERGPNQVFFETLFIYAVVFSVITFSVFVALIWLSGKKCVLFRKKHESIEGRDFLMLAFPMTPIMQYIIANQDILSFLNSIIVFALFFLISSIFIILIPWILSPFVSRNLIISISLAFLFIVFNMANFGRISRLFHITLLLALLSVVCFLLLFFNKKPLVIFVVLIFFISNVGISIFTSNNTGNSYRNIAGNRKNNILNYTADMLPENTPDIFLLIYESYSNQETMEYYGYDNVDQIEYLIDNGFAIYDGTYTLGPDSLISIGHLLHINDIDEDINEYRRIVSGDADAVILLNKLGYETHSVFYADYFTRGYIPKYDFAFPDVHSSIASHEIIIKAILEGEFRFDAEFSKIDYEKYIQMKQSILSQNLIKPEFMYTHNKYPGHSQNSGVLLPNETEIYIEGIHKANEEMRQDIKSLDLENRDAIVIIAGDHGPYLTKNGTYLKSSYELEEVDKMDIQDRYGSFLAIYWPDEECVDKYDIQILQDVLPAVFAYMYNDDNLFVETTMLRETMITRAVSDAIVKDGIIYGGIDDGVPLFENTNVRYGNAIK